MRCTICDSQSTHMLTRTVVIKYDINRAIVGAHLEELWLCRGCTNPFKPAVSRVVEWDKMLVTASVPRGVQFGRRRRLTRAAIIRELFRGLGG